MKTIIWDLDGTLIDSYEVIVESICDGLKELNIESIKAETNTSGQEQSLMQNQTPEEYAVKAMINSEIETFEIKIDSTQNIQTQQTQQTKPVEVSPSRIIDQVVKHLETLQNNSKVNIVLNPESLGKVNIQLLTTKEGLTAQFTVTTQEARDVLMKGLDGLKETLLSQGVNVDNVSVKLSDTQKTSYEQDWTEQEGSRGGNKEQGRSNKEEKEKGLFEQMMAQTLKEENGNV
jgi:flagellar hook-length control protein FliK